MRSIARHPTWWCATPGVDRQLQLSYFRSGDLMLTCSRVVSRRRIFRCDAQADSFVRLAGLMGLALWLMLCTAMARAADNDLPVPETDEPPLDVVLVVGEQRGPGLWKVVSGDHV